MPSSFISKISTILGDLFFPQTCLFCKTGGSICCQKCFADIPQKIRLENNILSIYHFSEPKINKLIWQLKYHHGGDIAKLFGCLLAEKMEKILFPFFPPATRNIYLIPIPLNQSDKRLHNHAALLANEIRCSLCTWAPLKGPASEARRGDVIVLDNLLIKNSKQKQSHTKGRQERFENVKDAFSVNSTFFSPHPNPPPSGEGKVHSSIYILIDDVTTSGATISEARKTLAPFLNVLESEIYVLTVAF